MGVACVEPGCARRVQAHGPVQVEENPERRSAIEGFAVYLASLPRSAEFLRLAGDSALQGRLRGGEVVAVPARSLTTLPDTTAAGSEIQHWIGAAFVSGVTLSQAIPVLADYSNRRKYMAPEIAASRELERRENDFFVYLQMSEKSIISGTFDTYLRIRYRREGPGRLSIDSRSEEIRDVTGADPHDRGLLWALNHRWRIQEADGGLYLECEALALSRRPPAVIDFLASRFIAQAARKALVGTLEATRRMLQAETALALTSR